MYKKFVSLKGIHKLFEKNGTGLRLKPNKQNYEQSIIFCTCQDDDLIFGSDFKDGTNFIWARQEMFIGTGAEHKNGILKFTKDGRVIGTYDGSNTDEIMIEMSGSEGIPNIYFDKALPKSKSEGTIIAPFHYKSNNHNINCYASLMVQGDSSVAYDKKNFTVKLYADAECTVPYNIDFGWGAHNHYVLKANWIDITHSRNIVAARLWGDIVASRKTIPYALETSPNYGAIDGFPIKFYGNNVYWGRYTWNVPKAAYMANMTADNDEETILCGENYEGGCFRKTPVIDGSDWQDIVRDGSNDTIRLLWQQAVNFIMTSDDVTFVDRLSDFFNVESLLEYYVYSLLICNIDGLGKNQIFMRYEDGTFFASAYDMDSTFGLYWDGSRLLNATYSRTLYEDMINERLGNLLYIKLERCFSDSLVEVFKRLTAFDGPMSYANVLSRFENFISIAPKDLVQEDYATTTGNGLCTTIPLKDTNNIQQIRSWYSIRIKWVESYLNAQEQIDLPEPTQEWNDLMFDGPTTTKSPVNTGLTLFDTSSANSRWTLFVHAKIKTALNYQNVAVHCMDETGAPYPGLSIQTNSMDFQNIDLEINTTVGSEINHPAPELWVGVRRDGNIMQYTLDGNIWNTINENILTHNSPLVIGGYCNANLETLNGMYGREFNGIVTVKYWNSIVDDITPLFVETFPDFPYEFTHTLRLVSLNDINSMSNGDSMTCYMVNPHKSEGMLTGFAGSTVSGLTGNTSSLNTIEQMIDLNIDNTKYALTISKLVDTNAYNFDVTENTLNMTSSTTAINGYTVYHIQAGRKALLSGRLSIRYNGNYNTNLANVYMLYNTNNHITTFTVNDVLLTVNNSVNINDINAYTIYRMTGDTTILITTGNLNSTSDIYVAIPNVINEIVSEPYYVIKTSDNYYIDDNNGTLNTQVDIAKAEHITFYQADLTTIENIASGINAIGNPNLFSIRSEENNRMSTTSYGNMSFVSVDDEYTAWLIYVPE